VFKDELVKLLPHDEDARRLSECAFHFGEFLERFELEVPPLDRSALLWGHCHQKATGGMECDEAVLRRMGVEHELLTGGCCGLAGSWGFEAGHHDVSVAIGEHALLPKVRELDDGALVVANGFSCATQIEQGGTGRRPLHLAQVIELARGRAGVEPAPRRARRVARTVAPLGLAALAVAGVALLKVLR
jgi:Fe-S oxidoreductase